MVTMYRKMNNFNTSTIMKLYSLTFCPTWEFIPSHCRQIPYSTRNQHHQHQLKL